MVIDFFTLFPEWFQWFTRQRHVQNALRDGHDLRFFNYRDTTPLSHGQVDDTPYGGGAGMVLTGDVVDAALQAAYGSDPFRGGSRRVVLLSPSGRAFDDDVADELASLEAVSFLCGRYEGVDERVRQHLSNESISIGRYVLSGGELAAMVIADAIARKLPGALGSDRSTVEESFSPALAGGPEYPHYTRPATYRGWAVPDVLLSGDHERVRKWRLERSAALGGGATRYRARPPQ